MAYNRHQYHEPREAEMERTKYRLDDIRPSRLNPRKNFDPDKLEELAASIKQVGVKESILIRRTSLWPQVCEWLNACGKGAKINAQAFIEARFNKSDWERVMKALKADGRVREDGRHVVVEETKPAELLDPRLGEPFLELVYGERRWRASKIVGLETIPATLEGPMTDAEAL
jgi:site-specific recombinase XerC